MGHDGRPMPALNRFFGVNDPARNGMVRVAAGLGLTLCAVGELAALVGVAKGLAGIRLWVKSEGSSGGLAAALVGIVLNHTPW